MSRSPTVSRMRRKLPATVTCSTPGTRLQVGGERLGILRRHRQLEAARLAGMRLHRLQDVELGLLAEAGQGADASVARRAVPVRRLHIEVVVEQRHPLRPQAGDLSNSVTAGGSSRRRRSSRRSGRCRRFPGSCGEVVADAGQPGQVLAALEQRCTSRPGPRCARRCGRRGCGTGWRPGFRAGRRFPRKSRQLRDSGPTWVGAPVYVTHRKAGAGKGDLISRKDEESIDAYASEVRLITDRDAPHREPQEP